MTTWHRIDDHGIPVQLTATPDERGNVQLTREELEGLLRTGGWQPGPRPAFTSPADFALALTRR